MKFLSKLLRHKTPAEPVKEDSLRQKLSDVTAKEKQLAFIKESLKPLLKSEGYNTAGNKWWKINGKFFNFIEIQNFSWNSRDSVDFCFNFSTGLTSDIKNPNKPTFHEGITSIRESYFNVSKNDYRNGANGYHIDENTDLEKFTKQVLNDFNFLILPKFNSLKSEEAILDFYSDDFLNPRVKQSLALGYKNVRIDN